MGVLTEKLKSQGVQFNENWLFHGEGQPWNGLTPLDAKDVQDPIDFVYTIKSYAYEPLLRKNTEMTLQKAVLTDINCPAMVAIKEASGDMHFGLLSLTTNKHYVLEAFQGHFYKILVTQLHDVFLINNMTFGR